MALTLGGFGTIPVAPDEHLVAGFGQEVIVLRPSFLRPRLLAVRAQGNEVLRDEFKHRVEQVLLPSRLAPQRFETAAPVSQGVGGSLEADPSQVHLMDVGRETVVPSTTRTRRPRQSCEAGTRLSRRSARWRAQVRRTARQARQARTGEPGQRGELSAELVEVDLQDQRKDGLRRPVRRAGEADVGGHRQPQGRLPLVAKRLISSHRFTTSRTMIQ